MNLYEHTIIARQDVSPTQLKQIQEKYSKIVEKNAGDIVKLEKKLADKLGAMVEISHSKKGGKISIAYHSVDELEGIINHFYDGS